MFKRYSKRCVRGITSGQGSKIEYSTAVVCMLQIAIKLDSKEINHMYSKEELTSNAHWQ